MSTRWRSVLSKKPPDSDDYREQFNRVMGTSPIMCSVMALVDSGNVEERDALKIAIVHFDDLVQGLKREVENLKAIVPRRFQLASGEVFRWDAPDKFVPLEGEAEIPRT